MHLIDANDKRNMLYVSQEVFDCMQRIPPIDPESLRPQGEWVVTYYTTTSKRGRVIANAKYVCPECQHSNGRKRNNYCPNCGVCMKGGTP